MKNRFIDLTEGGILSKLILIAAPIMGTQFMQMAYNLTDMFWLGKLGSGAVVASGTVGMYLWLSMAFLMFGRMGAEIGVSQNIGKGDLALAKRFSQNSFAIAGILGLAFMAVMIIARDPLIGFFNIPDEVVVGDSVEYLVIVSIGIPFSFLAAAVTGSFNAAGNSKTPFFANVVGLVLNIVLDPLLIFTFNLGIAGAAIATVTSQIVVCVLLMLALKFSRNRPFANYKLFKIPRYKYVRQILIWSTPIAIESLFFTFLSMLISRLVASWNVSALAVSRVGSQIESLSWLICGGFSSAVTTFIGQNFGAKKWDRIHRGYKISVQVMAVWGVLISFAMFFFAEFFIGIFLSDPAEISMGGDYLRILAACQFASCIEYTTAGYYRGIGRTLPPSIVSITCNILRVPLAYFLSSPVFNLGLNGIWWAITIGPILRGIWLFSWYIVDAIKRKKITVGGY